MRLLKKRHSKLKTHWPSNQERLKQWRFWRSASRTLNIKTPPVRIYKI